MIFHESPPAHVRDNLLRLLRKVCAHWGDYNSPLDRVPKDDGGGIYYLGVGLWRAKVCRWTDRLGSERFGVCLINPSKAIGEIQTVERGLAIIEGALYEPYEGQAISIEEVANGQ